MKKINHLGSIVSLILGWLGIIAGVAQLGNPNQTANSGNFIIPGIVIVLGALAYRSAKRRKLGERENTGFRIFLEVVAVVISMLLILLQNNLLYLIENDPVTNVIIPAWVLLAYITANIKKSPKG